jgi:hypothetical protein
LLFRREGHVEDRDRHLVRALELALVEDLHLLWRDRMVEEIGVILDRPVDALGLRPRGDAQDGRQRKGGEGRDAHGLGLSVGEPGRSRAGHG